MANAANIQVTAKNRWPDGSLRFAMVAGRAAVAASGPTTIGLSAGSVAASNPLTLSGLKSTGVIAAVDCGAFGTVTWADTSWDAPFLDWVSGPQMSSWIYRRPVGADAHLVAWLEVPPFLPRYFTRWSSTNAAALSARSVSSSRALFSPVTIASSRSFMTGVSVEKKGRPA